MGRLIFWLTDIFTIIWVFGNVTNGVQRNKIMGVGFLGVLVSLFTSIVLSIINKELLIIGVLIEALIVFFVSLAILGYLFRKIIKPTGSWKNDMDNALKEFRTKH